MRQLVEATGLHRQTIHFYLREGVLPPPADTRSGHARYGAQHLALLKLVRELRDDRGMSLDAMRRYFEQAGFDEAEARRRLSGGEGPASLVTAPPPEGIAVDELVRRADAPEELLRALVKAGAVAQDPDAPDERYGPEALPILAAARRLEGQGVSSDALLRLLHHAEGIAGVEVSVLASDASGMSGVGEPLARRAERRHADIGELVGAVRRASLRGVLGCLVEVGPRARRFAEDAIYIPSPLFLRRHRLDAALAEADAAAESGDARAARRLARLLLGLGRYAEAVLWFSRSAQSSPPLPRRTPTWASRARRRARSRAASSRASAPSPSPPSRRARTPSWARRSRCTLR